MEIIEILKDMVQAMVLMTADDEYINAVGYRTREDIEIVDAIERLYDVLQNIKMKGK